MGYLPPSSIFTTRFHSTGPTGLSGHWLHRLTSVWDVGVILSCFWLLLWKLTFPLSLCTVCVGPCSYWYHWQPSCSTQQAFLHHCKQQGLVRFPFLFSPGARFSFCYCDLRNKILNMPSFLLPLLRGMGIGGSSDTLFSVGYFFERSVCHIHPFTSWLGHLP